MIKAALEHEGPVIVVGEGKTVWSHVHIRDLAELFKIILKKIDVVPSGRKGIYFCESGEHTHLEFSQRLARAGKELGLLESDEVRSVELEEAGEQWTHGVPERAELAFGAK